MTTATEREALIAALRKLSSENTSPRDCIDEAADMLEADAREIATLKHRSEYLQQALSDEQAASDKVAMQVASLSGELAVANQHIKHIGNDAMRSENARLQAEVADLKSIAYSDDGAGGDGMRLVLRNRELEAKFAALKQQKPVGHVTSVFGVTEWFGYSIPEGRSDLFLAAGAQKWVGVDKLADEFELRRLLSEERETTRRLTRALREAVESPTFMGEPVLNARAQQVTVPQGWKLVPIEPDDGLIDLALESANSGVTWDDDTDAGFVREFALAFYAALLSAAPQPPQGE